MKKTLILISAVVLLSSCTENQRAKYFAGNQNIQLPANHILMNVTWKNNADIWILSKDTITGICYFNEKSSWGILNGRIQIK